MKVKTVDAAVDLTAAGGGDPIDLSGETVPFLPNNTVAVVLSSANLAGNGELALEGRNDGGDWVQLTDHHGENVEIDAPGLRMFEVELTQEIRAFVTAGTGTGQIHLIGH